MPVHDDLINCQFGLWKVIDKAKDYIQPSTGWHRKRYLCECSCENHTKRIVLENHLKNGTSTNCGCVRKLNLAKSNKVNKKKYNIYDLSGSYGVGFTSSGEEFYFDLEDYDKIKNYYWYKNSEDYIVTNDNGTEIDLHVLIMNRLNASDGQEIDHIGGNTTRNDARKCNLRICSHSENMMNRGLQSNNKTNYTGVYYDKKAKKYKSYITVNKKQIYLGLYQDINDAIEIRKEAEQKYFQKYSYDNSQKERMNINGSK